MSAYLTAVLADAPVHYWRCADPGGAILLDIGSSPRSVEYGLSVGSHAAVGPITDGGATWFGDNSAAFYRDQDLTLAEPLSLECLIWMIFSAGAAQDFLTVCNTGGAALSLGVDASIKAHAYSTGGGITAAAATTTQHWHHLVLSQTAVLGSLYLDGALVGSVAGAAFNLPVAYILGAGGTLAAPTRFATGFLAEAAVYATALSAGRVAAHYAAIDALGAYPIGLVGGSVASGTGVPTVESTQVTQIEADLVSIYQNAP